MTYASDNVVIVGLGLIGGSLARALRSSGFSQRFIGYGHREASLQRGVELGVIDEFTLDLDEAIERADIIVICTPTLTTVQMLEKILPRLLGRSGGPVITDVASVKGNLRTAAIAVAGAMPPQLVLGHPIAGSQYSGVNASKADLFVDHRVILTPDAANDPAAVELVRAMWRSAGAEVVDMPSRTEKWAYVFFIEFEGHLQDEKVAAIIAELEEQSILLKPLGSYPQALL